jgi:sugar lactone lactonase YvrE
MKRIYLIATLFFAMLCCSAFAQDQNKKITFAAPQLYPEGIAFDNQRGLAYVSSVKTGTIGSVDVNGKYTALYVDKDLKSSFGMKVDEKKKWLWVCVGDPSYSIYQEESTFKKMGRVIAIDLSTGKKVSDIDLSKLYNGDHFINDLTFDDKGNVYITDSFSPVIYKIDKSGNPAVWAQDDEFKSSAIGLNGIAFHPSGFILAVNNSNGTILKIDIKDPKKVERVKIDSFFPGADGLWIDQQKNLIMVQGKGVNKLFKINSTDDWKTASVVGVTPSSILLQNPTTCGSFKGGIYVLNAKLNEISDRTIKPSDSFSFQEVSFQ